METKTYAICFVAFVLFYIEAITNWLEVKEGGKEKKIVNNHKSLFLLVAILRNYVYIHMQ
jgi:hypothetical protein